MRSSLNGVLGSAALLMLLIFACADTAAADASRPKKEDEAVGYVFLADKDVPRAVAAHMAVVYLDMATGRTRLLAELAPVLPEWVKTDVAARRFIICGSDENVVADSIQIIDLAPKLTVREVKFPKGVAVLGGWYRSSGSRRDHLQLWTWDRKPKSAPVFQELDLRDSHLRPLGKAGLSPGFALGDREDGYSSGGPYLTFVPSRKGILRNERLTIEVPLGPAPPPEMCGGADTKWRFMGDPNGNFGLFHSSHHDRSDFCRLLVYSRGDARWSAVEMKGVASSAYLLGRHIVCDEGLPDPRNRPGASWGTIPTGKHKIVSLESGKVIDLELSKSSGICAVDGRSIMVLDKDTLLLLRHDGLKIVSRKWAARPVGAWWLGGTALPVTRREVGQIQPARQSSE